MLLLILLMLMTMTMLMIMLIMWLLLMRLEFFQKKVRPQQRLDHCTEVTGVS